MTATAKRNISDRAKKLRSILRDHYTRDDMTKSIGDLLEDAMYLCAQRGVSYNTIEAEATHRAADAYHEARK